ncbi:CRISPR-associated protein Csb2 [Prauserella aidingensis]|uniref:type I-G CRISPR-associated protein Csb2 n=1 Tax=Prauserella aidingensis TaxID=387890 RepID=UPI0020A5A09E|nr:type I-U CRISPR-associated protein Csb2 [Prauserella aidingensis]MCP2255207.1 CRISPR-associated protein Csb2 [Prauserella aidingensis]
MAFSIQAEFPFGTYRARRPDATPDRVPSVARLHSALLAAAGFGPRAVESDGELGPCDNDEAALRWLENNPPTDVRIPEIRVSTNDAVEYRDDGTIGKTGKTKRIRKLPKQRTAVAVNGSFVWTWRESPPEPVAEALRALCADVPYLGTTESPVVLTAGEPGSDVEPTHELDTQADTFTREPGATVDIPAPGRVDELAAAHRAERSGKVGTSKAGTDERALSSVPPRRAVRPARYRARERHADTAPWTDVLLVPLRGEIAESSRVRVAVAAHRALIKLLAATDGSAPPVLTGSYPQGVRRTANRVAIHVIDRDLPAQLPGHGGPALAVLVPREAEPADAAAVYRAVSMVRELRVGGRIGKVEVAGGVEVVAGDRFWYEPAPGTVRLWRTSPPAVPDTRGRDGWTFTHAALLSLGFVWQGTPLITQPRGRGGQRDNGFVEAVTGAGAAVVAAHPLRGARPENYVHRVNPHAVVRPYRAWLSLGDLGGSQTVQAIGQSRHLGGGLLIPDDRPEGEWVEEQWA